jgi:hypothetical protein
MKLVPCVVAVNCPRCEPLLPVSLFRSTLLPSLRILTLEKKEAAILASLSSLLRISSRLRKQSHHAPCPAIFVVTGNKPEVLAGCAECFLRQRVIPCGCRVTTPALSTRLCISMQFKRRYDPLRRPAAAAVFAGSSWVCRGLAAILGASVLLLNAAARRHRASSTKPTSPYPTHTQAAQAPGSRLSPSAFPLWVTHARLRMGCSTSWYSGRP